MSKVKVRMLTSISSESWSYHYGQEAFVEPELAVPWIENGLAENVDNVKLPKIQAKSEEADEQPEEEEQQENDKQPEEEEKPKRGSRKK